MTTTRFPNGITNNVKQDVLGDLTILDPTKVFTYFDDYATFTATDWTITEVEAGTGSASEAITAGNGGLLALTNDDADNDSISIQGAAVLRIESGKKMWFESKFKISDATQADLFLGLANIDTTPFAGVTDGIYIRKADGVATFDCVTEKDNVKTNNEDVGTLVDGTFTTVTIKYDGKSTVEFFQDGVKIAEQATTNLVDDADIAVTAQIINGEAAAKALTLDYTLLAQER